MCDCRTIKDSKGNEVNTLNYDGIRSAHCKGCLGCNRLERTGFNGDYKCGCAVKVINNAKTKA